MDKIVKARKEHECVDCGKILEKGEKCIFSSERTPRYNADEEQIGINYIQFWSCLDTDACYERREKEFEG